jgi:hypothetical protein
MTRLPGYDQCTLKAERAAFLGIAASSLIVLAAAVLSASDFANAREDIIARLQGPPAETMMASTGEATNHSAAPVDIGPRTAARLHAPERPRS